MHPPVPSSAPTCAQQCAHLCHPAVSPPSCVRSDYGDCRVVRRRAHSGRTSYDPELAGRKSTADNRQLSDNRSALIIRVLMPISSASSTHISEGEKLPV
ncbi:unnamed protein product, partial [Staurois parvus]